jgi:hypothetical protein
VATRNPNRADPEPSRFGKNDRVRRFNLFSDELEAEDEWYRPGYPKRAAAVDEAIGATKIGGAVYELEEGERVCPYHYHHGVEEWLFVVAGTPTLRTANRRSGPVTSSASRAPPKARTPSMGRGEY